MFNFSFYGDKTDLVFRLFGDPWGSLHFRPGCRLEEELGSLCRSGPGHDARAIGDGNLLRYFIRHWRLEDEKEQGKVGVWLKLVALGFWSGTRLLFLLFHLLLG